MRRLIAAAESESIGYGGVSSVACATGISRRAITEGMKELHRRGKTRKVWSASRIRREGAGRKRTIDKDPSLLEDLDRLVDPVTRGDPESPLRSTCKSVRRLAEELRQEGHGVSYQTVAELLHDLDYSLQANQKTLEGSQHADRDQQFQHKNRKAQRYLKQAVKSGLDPNSYPSGIKVTDKQMAELRLSRDAFHGDWNYSLLPQS